MMKNNLPGEEVVFFFFSCSFYVYRFRKFVSYGFPIINFCNPGVHYETPCIKEIYIHSDTENSESVRFYSFRNIIMLLSRLDTEIQSTSISTNVYRTKIQCEPEPAVFQVSVSCL